MIALKEAKNIALMEEFGVLTKTEMLSRYEVEMEHYSKIINIEPARCSRSPTSS